jgi:hypothetical protein
MEAKLRKDKDHYRLFVEDKQIGSTGTRVSSKEMYQLSFENCDEIFGVVDVEKLAEKACPDVISSAHSAFKAGFQKALEILGNKKFSEEDVGNAIEMCIKLMNDKGSEFREHKQTVIQSLQQTEWEVEIVGSGTVYKTVLDCCANYHPKFGCSKKDGCSCINNELPKLDADGCLILKRK